MRITAPANLAGPCAAVRRDRRQAVHDHRRSPPTSSSPSTPPTRPGPTTTDGCSAFTNAAAVAGKWAYVDRGTCAFADKVANAKAAGATGIVIGNNNVDPPAGFIAVTPRSTA